MAEMLSRAPRRTLLWAVVVAAIGVGIAVWRVQGNASASSTAVLPSFKVARANLVVSVGGVGRIVEKNASGQISVPSSSSSATSSSAGNGSSSAPGDAVFARGTGHVARLLVRPGQRVKPGQVVAVLDDGGTAAASAVAAQNDLETAQVELEQRLTQDPTRGFPATAAEIAAARLAVVAAQQKLARLHAAPRPADVATARADVQQAEANLATIRGGTDAARATALRLAREAEKVALVRLQRLLAPANPADISAAEADLKKAIADKAALLRPVPGPTPEAIAAADQAVAVAQKKVDRLYDPADSIAIQQAVADLKKAYSDLSALENQSDPVASPQAIDAAKANVDLYSYKLDRLKGAPDSLDVLAAQADLAKALSDRAALNQKPLPPTQESIDAADQAIDAAQRKINRLRARPNPADVEAAKLDVAKARADIRALVAGPIPAALTAAQKAVAASKTRLAQLFAPPLRSDVAAANADIAKAKGDLAALLARRAPASKFDVDLAKLKVQAAQDKLAVARHAEQLLIVRTTTGGTVTSVLTRVGAPVDGNTAVATVSDLADLAVMVNLSEFDAARVKRGQTARISVDALGGRVFLGKVLFAALSGSDSGGGVVTFPVEVALKRVAGVKPGMNASVRIIIAERRNVLEVPLEAVTKDDEDRNVVTVVNAAGRTALKPVKLGLANNKNVEIVSGIRPGQRLVIATSSTEGD
jgi:RND family efflux transporter MFP subunit